MTNARARLFARRSGRGAPMASIRALALMNVMLKAGLPFHRALAASREIARGEHRRLIDRVFCGTLLGGYASIGRALERETEGLPKELVWVGRTLREYMLCGSEPDRARREEMLDRAFSSALDSCRQSLREAVSGLRVPVTTIFALGIVLPIVLATMLPLWGAAYSDGFEHGFVQEEGLRPEGGVPMSAMAVPILLFPAVCLAASARVLSDGDLSPVGSNGRDVPWIMAFFAGLGGASFLLLFVLALDPGPLICTAIAVPASMLAGRLLDSECRANGEDSMCDHPSELNAISARLMSGEHFVRAVAMASEDRSEKRRIFWRAVVPASGRGGEEGKEGETVKLIYETARNDCALAAQILRQVARHLNDMAMVRSEVRFELTPIAQSVLVATVFLSPFVLGIAGGFGSVGAAEGRPVEGLFVVFIAEMVLAGFWLVRRMGAGDGIIGTFARRPYLAVAVSALTFLASLSFSKAMFA